MCRRRNACGRRLPIRRRLVKSLLPYSIAQQQREDDISISCIIALIVIFAVYQSAIAIAGGDETDERDKLIDLRAERISGYALGIGLFWLVGRIVATESIGDLEPMGSLLIAVWILFAITASEIIKNISQIVHYRAEA